MIHNNFITVIISHERAETMTTLKSLEKAGYSGDYRIVIDDDDKQIDLYKKKYGDKIVVFSKKEIAKTTDIMNNRRKWGIPTYARNFVFQWAKENKYNYVLVIDDDIREFCFADDDINSKTVKRQSIKNINLVIGTMLQLLQSSNKLMAVGFCSEGMFFGGKNGGFKRTYDRYVTQCMIFNVNKNLWYTGQLVEDSLLSVKYFDKVALRYYRTAVRSPVTAGNKAGGTDYTDMYAKAFYSVIYYPSGHKVYDCVERRDMNSIMPKIIREEHKK